jgi:hypothetical protein
MTQLTTFTCDQCQQRIDTVLADSYHLATRPASEVGVRSGFEDWKHDFCSMDCLRDFAAIEATPWPERGPLYDARLQTWRGMTAAR